MDELLLPKSVERVVQVSENGEAQTIYKKPKSRRKSTKGMKRVEKAGRKFVEAMQVGNAEYLRRHDKSSRKRKDGWVRDLAENATRANEKALKKLRKIRFV